MDHLYNNAGFDAERVPPIAWMDGDLQVSAILVD
jgi:hypothetical protein